MTNNQFKTSDIALVAVLALAAPVERIDKANPRRVEFVFLNKPELQETIEKFWRGELRVDPRTYFESLRMLKARLYHE